MSYSWPQETPAQRERRIKVFWRWIALICLQELLLELGERIIGALNKSVACFYLSRPSNTRALPIPDKDTIGRE